MKCKICGHRSSNIALMNKHYRKEHPSRLVKRKPSVKKNGKKLKVKGSSESALSDREIKIIIKALKERVGGV